MGLITGIDVSSYQSTTFGTAGLAFCIIKATESTTYTNPKYTAQLAHARSAGLVVGHYHYARGTDSAAEVAYFAAHADVRAGDIVALDWEQSEVTPAARDAWLHAAKTRFPHNRVVLYCNVNYWTTRDSEHYAADGLWIADYSHAAGKPAISQPWVFHQYSSANAMDHNVARFTSKAALVAWANGLAAAVAVTTVSTPEDDEMSTTSVNGRAGLSWAAGSRHIVQVTYDPAQGNPVLRVVLALTSGPLVLSLTPANGSGELRIPAEHLAACRGVVLEAAPGSPVYDVVAV